MKFMFEPAAQPHLGMGQAASATDTLDLASKLAWTSPRTLGLLRAARELATADKDECAARDYLRQAYQDRMNVVIADHIESLREHDAAMCAQWRAERLAVADEIFLEAQAALHCV